MCCSKCQQLHLYAATIMIPAERFQRISGRYLPPVAIQSRYCIDISSNFITPGELRSQSHSPPVPIFGRSYICQARCSQTQHMKHAQFLRTTTECEASVLGDCSHVRRSCSCAERRPDKVLQTDSYQQALHTHTHAYTHNVPHDHSQLAILF